VVVVVVEMVVVVVEAPAVVGTRDEDDDVAPPLRRARRGSIGVDEVARVEKEKDEDGDEVLVVAETAVVKDADGVGEITTGGRGGV
jgi:hypothetical protein